MLCSNRKTLNYYSALGYQIASEWPLDELIPVKSGEACSHIDIFVSSDQVPTQLFESGLVRPHYQLSNHTMLFNKPGLAQFAIVGGKQLCMQVDPQADLKTARTYLLGTGLGMAMYQRNDVALHGSAVVKNGACAVIAGDCGAGKSTLSAYLGTRGFGLMADDLVAVHLNAVGAPFVHHAFPQQRITAEALELLQQMTQENTAFSTEKACLDDDKLLIKNIQEFVTEPMPLKVLVLLTTMDQVNSGASDQALKLESLRGLDKFKAIIENIYCHLLIRQLPYNPVYMKRLELLANQIVVLRVARPKGVNTLDQLAQLVEAHL